MSQRMMTGAVVLLIAASGMIPRQSSEMATLAGTFVFNQPIVNHRLTLVLGKDGSARLTTEALDDKRASTTQNGLWTVESGAVKLALTASSAARPRQMTLGIEGDSLVEIENDSTPAGSEKWTFRRR
jgi:hypothetical protein